MIDWTKPLLTVNGRYTGRLISSDAKLGSGRTHIVVLRRPEEEIDRMIVTYRANGRRNRVCHTNEDLINPPTPPPPAVILYFQTTIAGIIQPIYIVSCFLEREATTIKNFTRDGYRLVARISVQGNVGDGVPEPPAENEDEEE